MKTYFLFSFLLILTTVSVAQQKKYDISDPLDIKTTGWNKVLQLKNGNTVLVHLEENKSVVVKIFDGQHKEIASQKHPCRIFDAHLIRSAIFKGLIEVNNEAVLFIERERYSKRILIRLRFDGTTGKLIEETIAGTSESLARPTRYYVMKDRHDPNYAILFASDVRQYKKCDLHVTWYDDKHKVTRDVPLDVDRASYDSLKVTGADITQNGIMVTVTLAKLLMNRTVSDIGRENDQNNAPHRYTRSLQNTYVNLMNNPPPNADIVQQNEVYDYHVAMYYIAAGSDSAQKTVVDVSTDVYPYYSHYSYNPFARAMNVFVFSYLPIMYMYGIDIRRGSASSNLFFKVDEDNSDIKLNWVKNNMASAYLQSKTDTSKVFYGIPLRMFTNENGLTTVVTESFERYDEPETYQRYSYYNYFGNIGITQLDDNGNEIWGITLPHHQRFKSYRQYYQPSEVAKRDQSHYMLEDLPEQSYERQFVSINPYYRDKNTYIVFNDYNKNFNNSIEAPGDTVYTYNNTNACYYKIDRKREVTKHYVFGTPDDAEYKTSFIEGADFDDQTGVYATLLQCRKNDNYTLCMAWSTLE